MFGFETIGSATLIAHDERPVLSTDPWITPNAYFGSWAHDFEIPQQQLASIHGSEYVWFSHGHPDHLNADSLEHFTDKKILLANISGGRIAKELTQKGLNVAVLPSKQWVSLSPRIRIQVLPNFNQDAILLVAMNDVLIINVNDSPYQQDASYIRNIAKNFKEVFHLQLVGWGGADMQNIFDMNDRHIGSVIKNRETLAGDRQRHAIQLGATHCLPFSSFHRFQRTDSAQTNLLIPDLCDYAAKPEPSMPEVLPAFIRFDVENKSIVQIEPRQLALNIKQPEQFGDSWNDSLTEADKIELTQYFRKFEHLQKHFGFVHFEVGNSELRIPLDGARERGFTFRTPRASLMKSIQYEVFDDLMIGNFTKITCHGKASLYPHFTPYVAKFGDNAGMHTEAQLADYFAKHSYNPSIAQFRSMLDNAATSAVKLVLPRDSELFKFAKRSYHFAKFRRK